MYLNALSRNLSDHNSLLFLVAPQVDWGPKTFKSLDCWWSKEGFVDYLQSVWNALTKMSIVAKLRCPKSKLKGWNRVVFGNLNYLSSTVNNEIEVFEIIGE